MVSNELFHLGMFFTFCAGYLVGGLVMLFIRTNKPRL